VRHLQIEVFIIEVDSVGSTQGNPNPEGQRTATNQKPDRSGRVRVLRHGVAEIPKCSVCNAG